MLNRETSGASETTDAIIIGGGVIGLAIARSLRLQGLQSVTLIERGRPGMEASHAAAGMLAPQVEADGADAFLELACRSRDSYPDFAAALFEETGIDIELERTGTLLLSFSDEDEAEALRRYEWQSRAGLSVEQLTNEEARELEPCLSPLVRSALRFPRDWQVENRRLVAALAASADKLGVRLLTNTSAESVLTERGRVTGVETSRGRLSAGVVVIAGGAWASLLTTTDKRAPAVSIEPVRGQMLCFAATTRPARHVIYSPRGYLVPRLDGRLLCGSTTERVGYEKSVTGYGLQTIMAQALEIAPVVSRLPLADCWAGLRPRAADDWPVLGMSAELEGLCYAAGHYRNGILLAPLTGELIAERITGADCSSKLDAFSPDRFQLAGVG
ncbi:MAG: glycine oxidase [Blastocatellia bacterium]|jgi:glycine oxidase|nr:glycine oxidase [Blastocatellia bacterium]